MAIHRQDPTSFVSVTTYTYVFFSGDAGQFNTILVDVSLNEKNFAIDVFGFESSLISETLDMYNEEKKFLKIVLLSQCFMILISKAINCINFFSIRF